MTANQVPPEVGHAALNCGRAVFWRNAVIPFLSQGINQGEACVYLASLHPAMFVTSQLALEGFDVQALQFSGQFRALPAQRVFLPQGEFDLAAVMEGWVALMGSALRAGFAGLRLVADMAWACYRPPGWEMLEAYERLVDEEVFDRHPIKCLCFYDRLMFPQGTEEMLRRTHQTVISDREPQFRVGATPPWAVARAQYSTPAWESTPARR